MKYIDEFRNPELTKKFIQKANGMVSAYGQDIMLMEVCGTHMLAISCADLRKVFPSNLKLLSGRGCLVYVTPNEYLDRAIAYFRRDDLVIVTFGDMMKVLGSNSSLERKG